MVPDLSSCRVFDLAQPYFVGMPHFPTHPPFLFSLTKLHGDYLDPSGMSSAADSLAMSGHTGTHIDALNHFSCNGKFFNCREVADSQSYAGGVSEYPVSEIAPIVRRGVLLDIAGLLDVDALPQDFSVLPEHLEACDTAIGPGDVVFLRTGWGRFWSDSKRYISQTRCPGPELAGAEWLSKKRVFAVGSDTVAFERIPNPAMPVHVHLLVDSGIHILENLNLEELARHHITEFLLIAAPLKIQGGTGAPVRPIAFVS